MNRFAFILSLALAFAFLHSCNSPADRPANLPDTIPQKFEVGQVWKYHNRPGEDGSTVTILKIEKSRKGDTIFHIRVDGIKLYNPQVEGGIQHDLEHLPYSSAGLNKTVTTLDGHNYDLPDFSEGYNNWKKSYDKGKAGVWTVEVAEAINILDSVMRSNDTESMDTIH